MNKVELEKYQNQQLISIVKHAGKNVPYYRELFKSINLDISTFRGKTDIVKIPFLEKEVLRKRYKEFISENATNYENYWEKTSGSTGTPLRLLIDKNSKANKFAITLRAYKWAGYKFGDWIFSIRDISPNENIVYSIDRITRRIYFYSNQITKENCLKISSIINKYKPKFYLGYGNSFLILGDILKKNRIEIPSPIAIVNFGENISKVTIAQLEFFFNTKVFDYYSHTENAVMINQCKSGTMHIAEDYAYHEVINENDNVITKGKGELVGTCFYSYSMPLIRYKTSDFVILSNQECNCGLNFREVDSIVGRRDDYIVTPDGKYLFLPEGAISNGTNIIKSQYIQDASDHLLVKLIVDKKFQYQETEEITKGLRKRIGKSMKIDYEIVNKLEIKGSGKIPFIISKIGNTVEYDKKNI